MFANGRIWPAHLIVFVASACALVIELIAGRILAPYVGVSLYTWTSIIGIVLAGMSLGNYLGGLLADRRASRHTLGLIFLAGSVSSLGILVVTQLVTVADLRVSLLPRIILYTTAIFLLPSVVLGMVSPVVVKLALADLRRTGSTVGAIYAFSTAGSICGTFLTGFWLISWLGTRTIVWLIAAILLLLGLAVGELSRGAKAAVGIVAVTAAGALIVLLAFGLVSLGWSAGQYRGPCQVESNYYCIQIREMGADGHPARALMLDRLIHSFVVLDDPTILGYAYEKAYAVLTAVHAANRPQLDALFLGGGGYTFPRYLEAVYPSASVDVIEIDPAVTRASYEHLGLSPSTRIRSFNGDARMFLKDWTDPKQYDLVYGDAFNDLSIPYHLTTVEFARMLYGRLKPDGIYLANVIDKLEGGEFLRAYANSLRQVFPHVYVFARGEALLPFDRNTYVIMASRQPLDQKRLEAANAAEEAFSRTTPLPDARLDAYLRSGRALILTDDFAPVDQLLANLFVERGS